jgi:seryl-tRNA synthetase
MNYKDFVLIEQALSHYICAGFEFKEVPWHVSEETIKNTTPKDVKLYTLESDEFLVASAEQGFLNIWDELEPDKFYCGLTPCFRPDVIDEFHKRYFMKLELFCRIETKQPNLVLDQFVGTAKALFSTIEWDKTVKPKVWSIGFSEYDKTTVNKDILIEDIEVGSYLVHKHEDKVWVCGTGIAVPRFRQAYAKFESRFKKP